jgi:hypothetical protein
MRIAIMQPYFYPYIGYFQLMNAVDEFIIYDNIKFTKKGWINRNRILVNGKVSYISLPIKKDSDYLDVKERYLADTWSNERKKILNRVIESYRKAPFFESVYPIIEESILFEEKNLFKFIINSLGKVKKYLEIPTSIIIASSILIDHELKSEEKVIEICKARKATMYINPIGGTLLYNKQNFLKEDLNLHFLKTNDFEYKQYDNDFIPFLSIVDVMMFNSKEGINELLNTEFTIL